MVICILEKGLSGSGFSGSLYCFSVVDGFRWMNVDSTVWCLCDVAE